MTINYCWAYVSLTKVDGCYKLYYVKGIYELIGVGAIDRGERPALITFSDEQQYLTLSEIIIIFSRMY